MLGALSNCTARPGMLPVLTGTRGAAGQGAGPLVPGQCAVERQQRRLVVGLCNYLCGASGLIAVQG